MSLVHGVRSLLHIHKRMTNAEYIGSGKVDVLGMVTHQVNLSEGPEMFKKIIANPKGYGKVLLYPEEDK